MSLFSIITNFTAGVFSPRLDGRVDFAKYWNAAKTLYNMIILPQGGVTRRPGTQYISSTQNGASTVRLIPFEFSNTQAYVMEFGHQYIRWFASQGVVLNGAATGPYEIATTINEASLSSLRWALSADTMFIVSAQGDMPPAQLVRGNHASWAFGNITFTQNPFNGATTAGYPKCCGFFEQRSVWANTRGDPQKLWFSKTGDYKNLSVGMEDDSGIAITIAADSADPITWMTGMKALLVGTGGGEWRISSEGYTEPLTPTNVIARRESNWGAADAIPAAVDQSVLYVARHNRKIREFFYSEVDGSKNTDLSLLAEHLTSSGHNRASITQIAFQRDPDAVLWAVQSDGRLLGMTYNRPHEVIGWHDHESSGSVENICVIPGDGRDELWLQMRRVVNNIATRFVEIMHPSEVADPEDAWYVDSGLQYAGSGATTITGLNHLNGASVDVLADGAAVARTTVNAGSIVLTNAASTVIAGLPYASRLETMRLSSQAMGGTEQTRKKRISSIGIRVYRSAPFLAGYDEVNVDAVPMRTTSDAMNTAVPLYTGDKEVKAFRSNWDRDGVIWIIQDIPMPLTVLAVVPKWKMENV